MSRHRPENVDYAYALVYQEHPGVFTRPIWDEEGYYIGEEVFGEGLAVSRAGRRTVVLFAYHLGCFVRIRAGNRPEVIK